MPVELLDLPFEAMMFARRVHDGHVRKYTGTPYIEHLAEVAGIVATSRHYSYSALAVAWLHDCVEDRGVTREELLDRFGYIVAEGVMLLSDLEEGNRATRKQLSRERLMCAPPWIQTIKYADLISNTASITKHDPSFAKVYLAEKRELLAVMDKGDQRLYVVAKAMSA